MSEPAKRESQNKAHLELESANVKSLGAPGGEEVGKVLEEGEDINWRRSSRLDDCNLVSVGQRSETTKLTLAPRSHNVVDVLDGAFKRWSTASLAAVLFRSHDQGSRQRSLSYEDDGEDDGCTVALSSLVKVGGVDDEVVNLRSASQHRQARGVTSAGAGAPFESIRRSGPVRTWVSASTPRRREDCAHESVLLFAHFDRQVLVHDLANEPPSRTVWQNEHVVSVGDCAERVSSGSLHSCRRQRGLTELVGDVERRAIRGRGRTTVHHLFRDDRIWIQRISSTRCLRDGGAAPVMTTIVLSDALSE